MRTSIRLAAALLIGCTCAEYNEATDRFSYAMSIKPSQPDLFRSEMESALTLYQASLTECRNSGYERIQTLSMITRCLLELDRFAEAERTILDMGEALDKRFGKIGMAGDRLANDLYRAQYLVYVGRRALLGIQEASTDTYAEMKLHLARPYYEEALRLYRANQSPVDSEIQKYVVLLDVRATLELARGYIMPKTPAAKQNYRTGRDLLAGAMEKVRAHAGPPLQAEFEQLRPELAKDLEWVEAELRR
jgi:hypothetical protein